MLSFISGSLFSNNVLLAHEVSHFVKARRGQRDGYALLKLDMSKAFDRVSSGHLYRS